MLELTAIHKKFGETLSLYNGLNLNIEKGDFVCVIGSNGSGKSTLLNLVTGEVHPDSGSVNLDGKDMLRVKRHERLRTIARVYQDPTKGTSPSLTIEENMKLASCKGTLMQLGFLRKCNQSLEGLAGLGMGLENKADHLVESLSGGQRQALSLLMATMNKPELLLLDEHTAALDPKSSDVIMKYTDSVIKNQGLTAIMVTHNLHHAIQYGNRLLMFHQGRIVLDVSGEEKKQLTREKIIRLFMELDQYYSE